MAGWKNAAKKAEKKVFGSGGVKGRYGIGKGKGGFKIMQLAKDLEMVKSRLNVEKKNVDTDVSTSQFAQVNYNGDGIGYMDITPYISQGVGESQRVGASIKFTGATIPLQFSGDVNTKNSRRIRMTVLAVRSADNGVSTGEAKDIVFDPNPLTGVRDYNCPRAYRNSKTDGISVLYSKTCTLPAPAMDSASAGLTDIEVAVKNWRINLKMSTLARFANGGDVHPTGLKFFLILQADCGNMHPSATSTLDVPVKYQSSGINVRVATKFWYVDN